MDKNISKQLRAGYYHLVTRYGSVVVVEEGDMSIKRCYRKLARRRAHLRGVGDYAAIFEGGTGECVALYEVEEEPIAVQHALFHAPDGRSLGQLRWWERGFDKSKFLDFEG